MAWFEKIPLVTPVRGAILYAAVGGLWILFSDQFVLAVARNERTLTLLQSAKGSAFVVVTAGFVYGLSRTQSLQREALTRRIRAELHHVSILHRILRHNVRNQCSIIQGYLASVATHVPEEDRHAVDAIENAADRLVSLSEKASRLNKEISEGKVETRTVDVASAVGDVVATVGARYPDAEIRDVTPEGNANVEAVAPAAFDWILEELLVNAVEHNDRETPRVVVAVGTTAEAVVVTVEDNGPGLPRVEHELTEVDPESPLRHSEGVGLWVVRILTTLAGGSYELVEETADGAAVELGFPKADRRE